MHALGAFGTLAFVLCLVLTPVCRDLAIRWGFVDMPDGVRKIHRKPIPRIGGIPIALSYALALGIMLLVAPHGATLSVQHRELILDMILPTAVIFITGLVDDLLTLKPWQKLSGQVLASMLVLWRVAPINLHGHSNTPWITIPLSLFWLIGCTNAFNLIDGLDGLAAGVGLFATLTTAIVALVHGNLGLAMATAPLAGCLVAFLRYNFSPASVFLGDSGSLTLGFMLGCFSLIWCRQSGSLLDMSAPLMALALPLIDVGLAISRRMLRSNPIFAGDRGHIHHMVLARGFKPRDAALILYGVCALAAALSLLQSFVHYRIHGLVIVLFLALVFTGVNYLGYIEFIAAGRLLNRRKLFRLVKEEIYLQELTASLHSVKSAEECWSVVCNACRELKFASVEMKVTNVFYQVAFLDTASDDCWKFTINFGRTGHLTVTRMRDVVSPQHTMAVLDHLQKMIGDREYLFTSLEDYASDASAKLRA